MGPTLTENSRICDVRLMLKKAVFNGRLHAIYDLTTVKWYTNCRAKMFDGTDPSKKTPFLLGGLRV